MWRRMAVAVQRGRGHTWWYVLCCLRKRCIGDPGCVQAPTQAEDMPAFEPRARPCQMSS